MDHVPSSRWMNVVRVAIAAFAVTIFASPSRGVTDLLVSGEATHSVKRFDGITGAFKGDFITSGAGGLAKPEGLAYGPDGNLYVSSSAGNKVLRYDGQTGAFLGVALQANITTPWDLHFGSDGLMYVSSSATNRVVAFNPLTEAISRIIGATGSLSRPDGLSIGPDGMLYVCSTNNARVLKYNPTSGAFLGIFASANLSRPNDIVFGTDQLAYVLDNAGVINRYNAAGQFVDQWRTDAGSPGLVLGSDGLFYSSNYGEGTVLRFGGVADGVFVLPGEGGLANPTNMIFMIPSPGALTLAGLLGLLMRRRRDPGYNPS